MRDCCLTKKKIYLRLLFITQVEVYRKHKQHQTHHRDYSGYDEVFKAETSLLRTVEQEVSHVSVATSFQQQNIRRLAFVHLVVVKAYPVVTFLPYPANVMPRISRAPLMGN